MWYGGQRMTFEGRFSPFTLWGWTQAWWKTLLVAEPSRQSPLWIHKNREPALMLLWFTLELNLVMCLYYPGVGDDQMAYWGDSFFPFLLKGIFRNLRRVESSEELWEMAWGWEPTWCPASVSGAHSREHFRLLKVQLLAACFCESQGTHTQTHTDTEMFISQNRIFKKNLKWKTMRRVSACCTGLISSSTIKNLTSSSPSLGASTAFPWEEHPDTGL